MQVTNFLLVILFFPMILFAQEQDHPCLNKEKMQKAMHEYAQLFKEDYKLQKFLKLSEEEQKQKMGKWLTSESYQSKVLNFWSFVIDVVENKKFDEENLETMDNLLRQAEREWSPKNRTLCGVCGNLVSDQLKKNGTMEHKKEFEIGMFFYQLRKEEAQKFAERQRELQELKEKALNDYDSLASFFENKDNYEKFYKFN